MTWRSTKRRSKSIGARPAIRCGSSEGERIPRAKFIAVLEDFYRRANPDKVANAGTIGWMIDYYEGCEELLYERLEQRYESVPGRPFKVRRTGPPFPAPEAAEPEF